MYPQLHAEMIPTRQQEIAVRTSQARHIHDAMSDSPRPPRNRMRVRRTLATVGACLLAGAAITVSDASAKSSGESVRFTHEVRARRVRPGGSLDPPARRPRTP